MNIFDLPESEFLAALPELAQQGIDTEMLVREYRRLNSPFAAVNRASAEAQSDVADEGRRGVAGGLLSKEIGTTGLAALRSLRIEPRAGLLGMLSGAGQAVDAPAAAARGLIPQGDMALEALGTAGAAMVGGGAAVTPSGSLRANSFRLQHASPQKFDRFDMGRVGTGEGGALLGRGINLTDNPDVAKYYQRELAGGGGFLYDVDVNASPDDFLDWDAPLASQPQSVRNALEVAGLPLGELPKEFRWNGYRGSISLGANRRFGEVAEDRGGYVARVRGQEVGRFSSPEAAGEALMRIADERSIVARGDAISGYEAFLRLGGRGEGEQALLRAGIPGAKMHGEYGVGPATDFSVYDDRILSIASRNGERLAANASIAGGLSGLSAEDLEIVSQMESEEDAIRYIEAVLGPQQSRPVSDFARGYTPARSASDLYGGR